MFMDTQSQVATNGSYEQFQIVRPPLPAACCRLKIATPPALHQHCTGHEQRGGTITTSDGQRAVDDARLVGKGCRPRGLLGGFRLVHRRRCSPFPSRLSPGVLHAGVEVRFFSCNHTPPLLCRSLTSCECVSSLLGCFFCV